MSSLESNNKIDTTDSSFTSNSSSNPSSDEPEVKVSFVHPPSDQTRTNLKAFRRELERQILEQPTTEGTLKRALDIYDIENGYDALTPDVLSALERLYRLEEVEWPSERERMYLLASKVSVSLKRLLRSYGYVF